MIHHIARLTLLILNLAITSAIAQEQQFADIGDLKLGSGEKVSDCRLGYRTFGTMNADRSNVILYLMWAGGKTEQLDLKPTAGGKLIDTNKYYVVAIDPLSNGVSSSPSNSRKQPRMRFPQYSMADLVTAEHILLTKTLSIDHVHAITGVSMGGIQTFQWMVSYPDFMDIAIPIVGSPQLAPYDLLHWQTQIDVIMNDPQWKNGDYTQNPARGFEYEFGAILLTTPDEYNRTMTREKVLAEIAAAKSKGGGSDANNKIRQVQAMMSADVTEKFEGSWEKAAAAVRARSLIIVSKYDHTVTPGPALKFASLLGSQTMVIDGTCGHSIHLCDQQPVNALVDSFLSK